MIRAGEEYDKRKVAEPVEEKPLMPGDSVKLTAGKFEGKTGKVLQCNDTQALVDIDGDNPRLLTCAQLTELERVKG